MSENDDKRKNSPVVKAAGKKQQFYCLKVFKMLEEGQKQYIWFETTLYNTMYHLLRNRGSFFYRFTLLSPHHHGKNKNGKNKSGKRNPKSDF